jgi:hypothetical protein
VNGKTAIDLSVMTLVALVGASVGARLAVINFVTMSAVTASAATAIPTINKVRPCRDFGAISGPALSDFAATGAGL